MTELKAKLCPFCGKAPEVVWIGSDFPVCRCVGCFIQLDIDRWNDQSEPKLEPK